MSRKHNIICPGDDPTRKARPHEQQPEPRVLQRGRSVSALRSIATIGLIASATLVIARALKPPVMYCDVCGDETLRWMAVHRANEHLTRHNIIATTDTSPLATVCPECSWDIYHLIDTAVRDVIDQARTPSTALTFGGIGAGKTSGAAVIDRALRHYQEDAS